jgi:hypothetical protein
MQKDVIYIDVEDDITAIIGKVKDAKQKVVALVPPKRIGVLQSAVNLRLLARAGEQSHKRVVLITNNQALSGLAGSAKIPVAKNLQSKPELAEIPALAVDDEDDIIDGEQLPVGELARTADAKPTEGVPDSVVEDLDIDGETTKKASPPAAGSTPTRARVKSGVKVPSFSKFRKKIFILGALGLAFIAFLVWAIWFAPQAKIIIDAQTTDRALKTTVTIGADVATDATQATIKSAVQQEKDVASIDFDATGTKDIGEKATGQVKLSVLSASATPVPAGTQLTTDGGLVFVTDGNATIPSSVPCFPTFCAQSVTVAVTASASGTKYNAANGNLSGAPSGASAQFTGPSAGGTEKIVKIVLQADVIKAKDQLAQQNNDVIKTKLKKKFTNEYVIIDSSFAQTGGDPQPSPAIGQEAPGGKAKLTRDASYTLTGVLKNDLDTFITEALKKTLTSTNEQRVYDNGLKSVQLADFKQGDRTATLTLSTTGQIGPKIDDAKIKDQVKGKRYGEVQAELKAIDGVNDADTQFWPFWVQTVPSDVNKIKIEFKLKNGA